MSQHSLILGIETSCDETGACVYSPSKGVLSHALYSQIATHKQFGGVVPELASRQQLEKIVPVCKQALSAAQVSLDDINVVAVTNRPGLPGSLLVGLSFAKALAWTKKKKIIGINHLEGHTFSSFLEHNPPFPHICLTASGGHTSLHIVHDFGKYDIIGHTKDDAAGEAFDKIAKLLDLGYPGGPIIETMAREINFFDRFCYPRSKQQTLDFSFSGLKTAVLYDLVKQQAYDMEQKLFLKKDDLLFKQQVASSLLVCIADIFVQKLRLAIEQFPTVKAITFVGGVACNKYIKQRIQLLGEQCNRPVYSPSPQYCTDNGAMIAFVGAYKAAKNEFDSWDLDIQL